MTMTDLNRNDAQVFPVRSAMKLTELVLGHERDLVARVAPLVRKQSIALDLAEIERVDAAGIAALIELYTIACKAGHGFCLMNATPHVTKVLSICGLDRILLSHDMVKDSYCGRRMQLSAA